MPNQVLAVDGEICGFNNTELVSLGIENGGNVWD